MAYFNGTAHQAKATELEHTWRSGSVIAGQRGNVVVEGEYKWPPASAHPNDLTPQLKLIKHKAAALCELKKGEAEALKPLGRLADVAVDGFQLRETETSARVTRLGKKASTRTSVRTCNNAVFAHILCRCACVVIKVIIS